MAERSKVAARLWARADTRDHDACWAWKGYTQPNGYGQIKVDGRARLVHRVAYEIAAGPIPEGTEIDHICSNRGCVNPAHLEAVAHLENVRRGASARKTHCIRGHPLSGDNLRLTPAGERDCRACDAFRHQRRSLNRPLPTAVPIINNPR